MLFRPSQRQQSSVEVLDVVSDGDRLFRTDQRGKYNLHFFGLYSEKVTSSTQVPCRGRCGIFSVAAFAATPAVLFHAGEHIWAMELSCMRAVTLWGMSHLVGTADAVAHVVRRVLRRD